MAIQEETVLYLNVERWQATTEEQCVYLMRVERQQSDYQRQMIAGLPQRAGGGLTPWATHCTTACPYQLPLRMPISAVYYMLSSYRS